MQSIKEILEEKKKRLEVYHKKVSIWKGIRNKIMNIITCATFGLL